MANIYYAKLNINSCIHDVHEKKVGIDEILKRLFDAIDTEKKYVEKRKYYEKIDGKLIEKEYDETIKLSDIQKIKEGNKMYITGMLVRKFPINIEKYDEMNDVLEKVHINNNAISIRFYFDVKNEIITFCKRSKFGQIQFIKYLEDVINLFLEDVDFVITLIKNPFKVKERLAEAKKITKFKFTIIPPNAGEEQINSLYDCKIEDMKEANATKSVSIFEISRKNEFGLKLNSEAIGSYLNDSKLDEKIENGYVDIEAEGESEGGTEFKFSSNSDAPYVTSIEDNLKDNERFFINSSQRGIEIYIARKVVALNSER